MKRFEKSYNQIEKLIEENENFKKLFDEFTEEIENSDKTVDQFYQEVRQKLISTLQITIIIYEAASYIAQKNKR
jgi:predicted RNase H-like nuclease (RuvC/YqgF family)